MSAGAAAVASFALATQLLWPSPERAVPAASAWPASARLTVGVAGAARAFGAGDGLAAARRLTLAEYSGDRTGRGSFARATATLDVVVSPRPGLRLEVGLPLVAAGLSREARHPTLDEHIAVERALSLGLGDVEFAALVAPAGPPADARAGLWAGLWLSPPTGRPRALVPTSDGLLEVGPIVRAHAVRGPVALAGEALWRVRATELGHRLRLRVLVASAGAARFSIGAGLRADLPLGVPRAGGPAPGLETADRATLAPAPVFASTHPGRARLDAFAGAVLRVGPAVRAGVTAAAALAGHDDAAAFEAGAFVEVAR